MTKRRRADSDIRNGNKSVTHNSSAAKPAHASAAELRPDPEALGKHVAKETAWTDLPPAAYLALHRVQAREVVWQRIAAHLGTRPESLHVRYRWFGSFERGNVCVHIDRLLKGDYADEGLPAPELLEAFNEHSYRNDVAPVRRILISVGPEQTRECVAEGVLLLRVKGVPLALHIAFADPDPREVGKLTWYAGEDENSLAVLRDVAGELERHIDEHPIYAGQVITPHAEFVPIEAFGWDELILSPEVMRQLRRNTVELLDKLPLYQRNGLPLKRGLILAGPPGTGKTLAGKVLANDLVKRSLRIDLKPSRAQSPNIHELPVYEDVAGGVGLDGDRGATAKNSSEGDAAQSNVRERLLTFIWVSPRHIEGDPRTVVNVYALARRCAPAVIFFEDMDLYLKDRETHAEGNNPILGEFLNQLDGPVGNDGVITILTTNDLDSIERALRSRPGRFDVVIHFERPDAACRERLLRRYMRDHNVGRIGYKRLASDTDGLTGAELRELITLGAILAVEAKSVDEEDGTVRLKEKHLREALQMIAPSNNKPQIGFTPPPAT